MQTLPRNINPFALMLDPQAVIAQIERSERLEGLHRRVCRPLDKPLLGGSADDAAEGGDAVSLDASVDRDNDSDNDQTKGSMLDASDVERLLRGGHQHD